MPRPALWDSLVSPENEPLNADLLPLDKLLPHTVPSCYSRDASCHYNYISHMSLDAVSRYHMTQNHRASVPDGALDYRKWNAAVNFSSSSANAACAGAANAVCTGQVGNSQVHAVQAMHLLEVMIMNMVMTCRDAPNVLE